MRRGFINILVELIPSADLLGPASKHYNNPINSNNSFTVYNVGDMPSVFLSYSLYIVSTLPVSFTYPPGHKVLAVF